MKRIAVLTSGGDAPGMNAALRAVTRIAASRGVDVLGIRRGYEGLMAGDTVPLTESFEGGIRAIAALDPAGAIGGTLLGSARSAAFREPEGRSQAAAVLTEAGVEGLVVIGGNGSLTGAHILARESGLAVVGIPASIDNDIGATSTALGVDTALNTILEAADRISDTARAHRRAFVMEVMGRQCGYLAMAASVAAGADVVLFPEGRQPGEDLVELVAAGIERVFDGHDGPRRALIIKAEGVEGSTTELVDKLQEILPDRVEGVDVRAVVLGHVVRGGAPSFQDRMVATRLSFAAVQALLDGDSDVMASWRPARMPERATATADPAVVRVPLDVVLTETAALLDGSSPITQRRVQLMETVEGVMAL